MAIREAVNRYCAERRLHRLPTMFGPERRILCFSSKIDELLNGPWEDESHKRIGHHVYGCLLPFVEEELVTVRLGPPKNDVAQLAQLAPRPVWEIRCLGTTKIKTSVRVFGCIPAKNLFVALGWQYRNKLGGYKDPRWKRAIQECEDAWMDLFPFELPSMNGEHAHDYITGADPI